MKTSRKEYQRQYYLKNKEKKIAYRKQYCEKNRDKIREYFKEYYKKNKFSYKIWRALSYRKFKEKRIIYSRLRNQAAALKKANENWLLGLKPNPPSLDHPWRHWRFY